MLASLLTSGSLLAARPSDANPTHGCAGFISEAPGYSWDPEATLIGEDKPIKIADHSLDGGRYVITTTENILIASLHRAMASEEVFEL